MALYDAPCRVCGRVLPGTPQSLPAGERTCRGCRGLLRPEPRGPFSEARGCRVCGQTFVARNVRAAYCSTSCKRSHKPGGSPSRQLDTIRARRKAAPVRQRQCLACGERFTAKGRQMYCSHKCRPSAQVHHWSAPRHCDYCDEEFAPKHPVQRFCSAHCRRTCPATQERLRENYRLKNYRRRAARRRLDVTIDYERELRRAAKRCPMPGCGVRMTDKPFLSNSKELDHIVPINVGGTHTIGNVRIICRQCNQRRPDDGSDYIGPVTLWATEPGVVTRSHPRPATPTTPRQPSRPPRPAEGKEAARLRAQGLTWRAIAEATGLGGTGSAYLCAMKYGDPDDIAQWPRREVAA